MNEKDALLILEKNIKNKKILDKILNHSTIVKQIAVSIAQNINRTEIYKKKIDISVIKVASLLHDIGREKCPPKTENSIRHNIYGEEIIKKEIIILKKELNNKKTPESKIDKIKENIETLKICAKVCRNHTAVGFTKEEIIKNKINLPVAEYVPKKIEEKIICYADKLVDGTCINDINHAIERFGNWLGDDYKLKIIKLHKEIHRLSGDKTKIKIDKPTLKIMNMLLF